MELQYIIYEKSNHVAKIKLNRPNALNALNTDVLRDLDAAVTEVENDEDVRVAIITGEGKAFAAGADIAAMAAMNAQEGFIYSTTGQAVYRHIENVRKPFIAAINGFALGGGCEMTLACDIRIASTKAKLGLPETGLGIIPGFGGTQRLARIVGDGRAKEMIYTAGTYGADEALSFGLVNKVTEPDQLMAEAEAMAKVIAGKAPIAVAFAKNAINKGRETDLDTGLGLEAMAVSSLFATEDLHEGMTAFVEKRRAEYKGK